MGYGVYMSMLGVVRPPRPTGPTGSDLEQLQNTLAYVHESAHFSDLISSPVGFLLLILEQVRLFSQLRLFSLTRIHPVALPLKIPLANYIQTLQFVHPHLKSAAADHLRLRRAIDAVRSTYYGRMSDDMLRSTLTKEGLHFAAHIIPIFNRHFFFPSFSREVYEDFQGSIIETIDIVECLGMLAEFNRIPFEGKGGKEADLFLRFFARRKKTVILYNRVTAIDCFKKAPFLPRFVLWKALLGWTCVPYWFDHSSTVFGRDHINLVPQHPAFRLRKMGSVLEETDISVPNFVPYESKIEVLIEFDKELSKAAGLETLEQSKELFVKSTRPRRPFPLNTIEKGIYSQMDFFYDWAASSFRAVWDNIELYLDEIVLGFPVERRTGPTPRMPIAPTFEIAGNKFMIYYGELPQRDEITPWIVAASLGLEMDAQRPIGLFDSIAKTDLGAGLMQAATGVIAGDNLLDMATRASMGIPSTAVDWKSRITESFPQQASFS